MKKYLLLLCLFLSTITQLYAQEKWLNYTTSNSGLESNTVTTIAIDKDGSKWFGYSIYGEGVSRFDGSKWEMYNTSNSGLISDSVRIIIVDPVGNKWFVTSKGVSKFDGSTWSTYSTTNSGLVSDKVNSIIADDLGNVWFSTFSGVSKFDGSSWVTYNMSNSGLVSDNVIDIAIDKNGIKWILTSDEAISKFNDSIWVTYDSKTTNLPLYSVRKILVDLKNNVWIGTTDLGVYKFDGVMWTHFDNCCSDIAAGAVSSMVVDKYNNKWFGLSRRVSMFDDKTWVTYSSPNFVEYLYSIAIDEFDNKWITTSGRGVAVLLNTNSNNTTKLKKTVLGKVYLDKNQNQLLDNGENYLGNQKVLFNPNNAIAFTNANGEYVFQADSGSSYTIGYSNNNLFELTKDTTYTEIVKTDTVLIPDFPVYRSDTIIYRSNISSLDRGRCNTEVPVWFTYSNRGTTTDDVQVVLTLDADLQVKGSFPAFDSIVYNTLYYTFPQIKAGADRQIKLNIQNPTFQRMGDTLVFASKLTAGGIDFTTSAKTVITCSYDPNDKAVQPLPIGEENYTLKNEVLSYTVRFQNTGNDTAFYVAIKDTLDKNLDWNTFEVLGSSHTVNTTMDSSGVVTFEFANIVLPDSATNEPASNGFVSYSIQAPKTVAENTIVKNTAHIYFDQNPAIVTNTTINNLVTTIPNPSVGFENDIRITKSVFYPNPLTGSSILKFENKGTDATLQVQDVSGKLIFTKTSTSNEFVLHKNEFEATGLFIYTIQTENELLSGKLIVE